MNSKPIGVFDSGIGGLTVVHALLKNYAFIDSQNLNLGIQELGWKLDFTCTPEVN
jgi:hypothetical protein